MTTENDAKFDDELMAMAAALPKEVRPERDLWPEIESAIDTPVTATTHWSGSWWAKAAAVVLLVVGSSSVTWYAAQNDGSGAQPIGEVPDLDLVTVSGDFGATYSLGGGYLEAHDSLEGDVLQNLDALPEETRAEVIKNLNAIRTAINDINSALDEEPDNVLLQKLLMRTYHDEINLLRRVDGVANSAMRREDI